MSNSRLNDDQIMKAMRRLLLLLTMIASPAWCDSPTSVNTDVIINLPISKTWKLFFTVEGLQDVGYTNVVMPLKLNEKLHAERKLQGQSEILDGVISSFDPEHMLSWQWSNTRCWSVLYFNAMGNEMTQIRWLDLCSADNSVDLQTRAQYHRQLFDQLVRRYAPECHVCKEEREAGYR